LILFFSKYFFFSILVYYHPGFHYLLPVVGITICFYWFSLIVKNLYDWRRSGFKGPEARGRALWNVLYFEFQKLVTLVLISIFFFWMEGFKNYMMHYRISRNPRETTKSSDSIEYSIIFERRLPLLWESHEHPHNANKIYYKYWNVIFLLIFKKLDLFNILKLIFSFFKLIDALFVCNYFSRIRL
jgi:hypothetical protein